MPTPPIGRVQGTLLGLFLLGRGRPEGLAHFDASVQGFLASLAPWIAFALVDGFITVLGHHPATGALEIAILLCFVLSPAVISEALTLAWRRDAQWLRFATASTWCEWLMPFVFTIGWLLASLLVTVGLPSKAALAVFACGVVAYWCWLHFFLARAALGVSRLRASVLVVALVAGNMAIVGVAYGIGGQARALFGT